MSLVFWKHRVKLLLQVCLSRIFMVFPQNYTYVLVYHVSLRGTYYNIFGKITVMPDKVLYANFARNNASDIHK